MYHKVICISDENLAETSNQPERGRPAPLLQNMKIIHAEHLGMCFGVRDAIALALETARREPLTILGDLVHNETVLEKLRAEGIRIGQKPADIGTQTVMITAHGASERRMGETRGLGLNVLEATCPLVHVAHQ